MDLNKFGPSLRWMTYEAMNSGLQMKPFTEKWEEPKLNESLTGFWTFFEFIPFRRLSYKTEESTTFR